MVPGAITSLLLPARAHQNPATTTTMSVPEAYADAVPKLPDLQEVLKQQRPWMSGQPFQMQVGAIPDMPRGVGDPWRGAYSNHGFWWKMHEGDQRMFDQFVARSNEEEKFLMRYELLEELKAIHGDDVDFLVAANQRCDLVGAVVRGGDTVVVHFVRQDYRHSGIGSILLKEMIKRADGKQLKIMLNAPLYRSIERFGSFHAVGGSTLLHVIVTNPSGITAIAHSEYSILKDIDWAATDSLLKHSGVSLEAAKIWARDGQLTVIGDDKGGITAVVRVVGAAGGYVKRLVVGPLIAESTAAAEAVLHAALLPLLASCRSKIKDQRSSQNTTTDYPWNPDVQSLQRRTLHFRVPKDNKDVKAILRKFAGKGGVEEGKIESQIFSTDNSTVFDASKTFATGIEY